MVIFDIQHFCVHDGPGIRTTVFLKGCSLHCLWCHNPESISRCFRMMFYKDKCVNCGMCKIACRQNCHVFSEGTHIYIRENCILCGECVSVCAQRALEISGYVIDYADLMKQIERDKDFYIHGGGVTFSGGEPLIQYQELCNVLRQCRERGIHTAVETSLYADKTIVDMLDQEADLIICDYKIADTQLHRRYTGKGNEKILNNMEYLLKKRADRMWVRTPVIPGVNDTKENMRQMGKFLAPYSAARVELLPFHDIGLSKYYALGERYSFEDAGYITDKKMEELRMELRSVGVQNVYS